MPELKARANGQWLPAVGPPGVITKGQTTSTFARGAASVWADNDAGNWLKIADLFPSTASLTATNNNGRIDLSWTIDSTANISKYEVYFSTDGVNYSKWSTEPTPAETSKVFGRAAFAPSTYRFFIRSVALNGFTRDSAVATVSIPGVTAWRTFTHSRAASGWHSRSFTFTAGVQTTGSAIKTLTARLMWRQNSSQAWTEATTYTESNVNEMTKTFSFSSYDYGQRMFRVELTAVDSQTLQNNGTQGSGYSYTNAYDTSELTAADIAGAVPTISGSAPGKSDPGRTNTGAHTTNDRSLSFTVGFNANTDRSEYDSAVLVLFRSSDSAEIGRHNVDLNYLKGEPWTTRQLTYSFSSLPAGTAYFAQFYVYDDQGVDRIVRNDQTTFAAQSTTVTYAYTWTQSNNGFTADAGHPYWLGDGEYIRDAPYGAQYSGGKASLRDGNNNTWYVTTAYVASTGNHQRLRVTRWRDYSTNASALYPGDPGYTLNWVEFQTPQTHGIYGQVYDRFGGYWQGYAGTDPYVGDYYIQYNGNVNGNWRMQVASQAESLVRSQSGNQFYVEFDVRAAMNQFRTYSGVSGTRIALAEVRINVTWAYRYDLTTTVTYSW